MKKGKKKHTRFYDSSVIRKIAIVDSVVGWIERVSGQINSWAWDFRWGERESSEERIKGYKEWEKRKKN